jgi:hypothetical protein
MYNINEITVEELEQLRIDVNNEIINRTKQKTYSFESRVQNYVGKPYAGIVDSNKEVIKWLKPIATEFDASYTIKIYELDNSFIGKTIVIGSSSSTTKRKHFKEITPDLFE